MSTGEQPPGGGTHPQHNPYQQPGYQQPNPYLAQQPHPHLAQQPPVIAAAPPSGGGRRTRLVAIVTAATVVVAAGVTGFLVLGGTRDHKVGPDPAPTPTATATMDNPRTGNGPKATVAGWQVVTNPDVGIAFDVPPDWARQTRSWVTYVTDDAVSEDKPLVAMKAPAVYKQKWCTSDHNKDGQTENTALANVGTRGNVDDTSTQDAARTDSADWVYGWYAQPDHEKVTTDPVTSYTTASGLTGSVATSRSSGVAKKHKCDSNGTATTFAFKDRDGDVLSWSFVGATGVDGEVPDTTVRAILRTVRLYDVGKDSSSR